MELRYHGTFIDVGPESVEVNSPRETSSDPGSVHSRETRTSDNSFFQREIDYVSKLNLSQKLTRVSFLGDDDGTNSDSVDRLNPQIDVASESSTTERNLSSACSNERKQSKADTQGGISSHKRSQVMQTIQRKTTEAREALALQRLSTALTSIHEIPEQVEQVIMQQTDAVMAQVKGEVAVMQDIMMDHDTSLQKMKSEEAIQSIGVIPTLVKDSFKTSFDRAMSSVRIHLDDVVQGLEAEGSDVANARVLQQIQAIPAEIRQITEVALEQAVENSQEQVALQMGYARNSSIEPHGLKTALDQAQQISVKVPNAFAKEAAMATELSVEQALASVQVQQSTNIEKAMTNRVIADALLRAKATNNMEHPSPALRVCNPGSIGHPELCSRPCMFFTQGKCENGLACIFCHASHPRRAAHLDKRNREVLQRMDFDDRFALMGPILKTKLESMIGAESLVHELSGLLRKSRQDVIIDNIKPTREARQLSAALKFMSARSILSLLQKDAMEHPSIEAFLYRCSNHRRPIEGSIFGDSELGF